MSQQKLVKYRKVFEVGDFLLVEGDECDGFYILEGGNCAVFVEDRQVAEISADNGIEFIGEVGALIGTPRTASIRATTEATALFIPNSDLEGVISAAPSLGLKLAKSLCRKLANSDKAQGDHLKKTQKVVFDYMLGLMSVIELAQERDPKNEALETILSYVQRTNPWKLQKGDDSKIVDEPPADIKVA